MQTEPDYHFEITAEGLAALAAGPAAVDQPRKREPRPIGPALSAGGHRLGMR